MIALFPVPLLWVDRVILHLGPTKSLTAQSSRVFPSRGPPWYHSTNQVGSFNQPGWVIQPTRLGPCVVFNDPNLGAHVGWWQIHHHFSATTHHVRDNIFGLLFSRHPTCKSKWNDSIFVSPGRFLVCLFVCFFPGILCNANPISWIINWNQSQDLKQIDGSSACFLFFFGEILVSLFTQIWHSYTSEP